jgi:hypothetical protein
MNAKFVFIAVLDVAAIGQQLVATRSRLATKKGDLNVRFSPMDIPSLAGDDNDNSTVSGVDFVAFTDTSGQ